MNTQTLFPEFRLAQDFFNAICDAYGVPAKHTHRNLKNYDYFFDRNKQSATLAVYASVSRDVNGGILVSVKIERLSGNSFFKALFDGKSNPDVAKTARELVNAIKRYYVPDKNTRVNWQVVSTANAANIETGRGAAEFVLAWHLDNTPKMLMTFLPGSVTVADEGSRHVVHITPHIA